GSIYRISKQDAVVLARYHARYRHPAASRRGWGTRVGGRRELEGVPEAVGVGVGEEEVPGLAAVGGFVEAGEVSFGGGHYDGGRVVEGLDGAEVEVLGGGRFGCELPDDAGVLGAEDGAVGAGGPGDAVADVVDAAEVGGGVGVVEGPLGSRYGGGYGEEREEKECARHWGE